MANDALKTWWAARHGNVRLGLVCAVVAATVASLGAQVTPEPNVVLAKSGLNTVQPDHALVATVVETFSKAVPMEVRIEFRDAADQKRGYAVGRLSPGRPVRLRTQIAAGSGLQQLRAIVRITRLTSGPAGEPIITLENLDVDSLTIEPIHPCVPPGLGGGVQGNGCDGGWRVNRLTLNEPGPPGTADVDY